MHHGKGFIFISCLGVVEASHLTKLHLRRTAFGIKSYRDLNTLFSQENVYIHNGKRKMNESMFHIEVLGSMLTILAATVFQSSEVSLCVRTVCFFTVFCVCFLCWSPFW